MKKRYTNLILSIFIVFLLITGSTISIFGKSNVINTKKTENITENKALPTVFSWKNINGVDYTTSIKDLRPIPSCEAMAFCAALETIIQYKIGFPFECDLSEAHLFYCSGGDYRWGTYIEDAANYLKTYGVPDEACWPYPKTKKQYPCNTTSPDWMSRTIKISDWNWLPADRDEIKKAIINKGPVVANIDLFKDYIYYIGGIYRHIWGSSSGSHWISIIGYDDNQECWIVENSYGPSWGENGLIRVKYGEVSIENHCISIDDVYGNYPITIVDDDNTQGPWDGTFEHPYQYIQDAIDNTNQEEAVFVKNGNYNENIIIEKPIYLTGENPEETIINGQFQNDTVFIKTEKTTIKNFTIKNSGNDRFDAGIKIRNYATNGTVNVKNNIVQDNNIGIYLYWSSRNNIEENLIKNNQEGINIWYGYENNYIKNTISENEKNGIYSEYSFGTFKQNIIKNNKNIGIFLNEKSSGNIITQKNTIENNKFGIFINNSIGNIITNNNLIKNTNQAYLTNSYSNLWLRNYWDDWERIIPRKIKGELSKIVKLPWYNFDWFPKKTPN